MSTLLLPPLFCYNDAMNQLAFLKKSWDAGQLAHAYVFSGQDMAALKNVADELVAHAKCTFPDVISISSVQSESSQKNEKDMMEIDVDQIRQVQQFLSYKSYNGGLKTVVVENAERMNAEAQNCFLKSLEEPKGQTLIILLCQKPELLLPTIFSRCQVVTFLSGTPVESSPLSKELQNVIAGDLAEKFKYAKGVNLEGGNFEKIISALQQHFRNQDIVGHKNILARLLEMERKAQTTNVNKKLALEILLMEL